MIQRPAALPFALSMEYGRVHRHDRFVLDTIKKANDVGFWQPMRNSTGSISTNAAYLNGIGPELLTNGAFDTNLTPWIEIESVPDREASWQAPGFVRMVSTVAGVLGVRQGILNTGDTYNLSCNVLAASQANLGLMRIGSTAAQLTLNGTGVKTATFIHQNPADLSYYLLLDNTKTGTLDIDEASCKKSGEYDGVISASGVTLGQADHLGVANEAFDMDGANGVLQVRRTNLNGMAAQMGWVIINPDTISANDRIFFKSGELDMFLNVDGTITLTVNYGTTNASATTTTAVVTGAWQAVGYEIGADKVPHIYIGASEAAYSGTPTTGVGAKVSNTNPLQLGKDAGTGALDGKIADWISAAISPGPSWFATIRGLAHINP